MPCQEWLGDPHIGQSPIFINAPSYVVHFVSASSSSTSNSSGDCVKIFMLESHSLVVFSVVEALARKLKGPSYCVHPCGPDDSRKQSKNAANPSNAKAEES